MSSESRLTKCCFCRRTNEDGTGTTSPVQTCDTGGSVSAMLFKNGVVEETGLAAGVLNHPATGVAWLANKIAAHNEQLNAGDVVLAGSFTRPTTAVAGDTLHADYGALGTVSFRFV